MRPSPLTIGFVGSGFNAGFHARALTENGGIFGANITGVVSPRNAGAFARKMQALGHECKAYSSAAEMARKVNVIALCMPNDLRVPVLEEITRTVELHGAEFLKGIVCEKPLARNMAEANEVVRLITKLATHDVRFAYFENQIHMPTITACRAQLTAIEDKQGPVHLVRSAEEHGGPHEGWFWDPTKQGGGVLLDMGCHSVAVGQYMLTPVGKPITLLQPARVSATLRLLKWGRDPAMTQLREKHGVDYGSTPAEDYALLAVDFWNPDTNQQVTAQATDSWMYDAPGLKLEMEAMGPGYSFTVNTLTSPSRIFISDAAADACANAELALEKSQASRGNLAVLSNEPLIYGYVSEWEDALIAFCNGQNGLLDVHFGRSVVQILMAGYLSSETGKVVDLRDRATTEFLETYIPLIQQGKGAEVLFPSGD